MMSAATSILILEIAVVLLVIVCVLVFLEWKRRKKSAQEFEQLLEAVTDQQDQRKKKLIQLLVDDYALDAAKAIESSEYMLEAEKQFIQQFTKQQLEKTTVADSYGNLCELLDQYLYFIPKIPAQDESVEEVEAIETEEESLEPETPEDSGKQETEEEGKTEPASEITENETDAQEGATAEAEPDWGEAFSESGDEMDEAVKQGYEEEAKKE